MQAERLDVFQLRQELTNCSIERLSELVWHTEWLAKARAKQLPPEGDWNTWGIVTGRGWGKTETGANWTISKALALPHETILVIAPTHNDLRGTCFEGPSGLLRSVPEGLVSEYNRSNMELRFKNGALVRGFSATEPDRLRGINSAACWGDELAAWPYATESWDMMRFGLRVGEHPQVLFTTTPKPIPLLRRLMDEAAKPDSKVVITTGSTYENRDNLAKTFFDEVARYSGTQLGRQELLGELLDMEEQGIFRRSSFKLWPSADAFPIFEYIVQSWDTAFSEKDLSPSGLDRRIKEPDPTACTTWGVFRLAQADPIPGVHNSKSPWAIMLLDAWGEHMSFPDLRKRALSESKTKFGPEKQARKPDAVLIENKGSGISLLQELRMSGVPALEYNPSRDSKLQRAHMVSHLPAHGLIYIPESAKRPGQPRDWAQPLLDQLCSFSALTLDKQHDDFVDSTAQAWRLIIDQDWVTVDPVPEPVEVDYHAQKATKENPYYV